MADAPTTFNPAALSTVKIASTQILPFLLGEISIGEILKMNVRSNPINEPGLLYFRGQMLKAMLPPELEAGDKIRAQVAESGNQVILKLLEVIKSATPTASVGTESTIPTANSINSTTSSAASPYAELAIQLEKLLRETGISNLLRGRPQPLPQNLSQNLPQAVMPAPTQTTEPSAQQTQNVEQPQLLSLRPASEYPNIVREQVQLLLTTLGSPEKLVDAQTVGSKLNMLTNGSLASTLREAAKMIRTVVEEHAPPTAERFIYLLRQEIASLLPTPGEPGRDITRQINNLIKSVTQEIEQEKSSTPKRQRDLLRLTLTELKLAQDNPERQQLHLQTAMSRLAQFSMTNIKSEQVFDPKSATELQTLATRLEQMAAVQETLNQLNPIMQALGEPAMLLFPFILQGLISHSEITIDPDSKKRQQHKNGDQQEQDEENGPDTTPYQRIQIRVPLPSMGKVDVDIAHRHKDILVRFTVENQATKDFLLNQKDSLETVLREQDFTLSEFSADVSAVSKDESPMWNLMNDGETWFIA